MLIIAVAFYSGKL